MIDKKRLEELIEQGATVYYPIPYGVDNIKLTKLYRVYDWNNELYLFVGDTNYCPLSILFETKEEAEWHREFGCIERTERLELPTWEKFKLREPYNYFIFTSKDMQYGLGIGAHYREIIINNNGSVLFQEKFTKENYTLACRKAKELFLGEKK